MQYGHTSQGQNPRLFDRMLQALSEKVEAKKNVDPLVKFSGTIINTGGWVTDYGFESIKQAIKHFHVNIIVVLDNDRLSNQLTRATEKNKNIKVVHLPKSGGVVARSRENR